jgi:hypothetical protein
MREAEVSGGARQMTMKWEEVEEVVEVGWIVDARCGSATLVLIVDQ